MQESLRLLTRAAVDYAGLFPPAAEDMSSAVHAYAAYLSDPAHEMLGRFVVPVVRLRELESVADGLPSSGEPWRLTALVGPDVMADLDLVQRFNERHATGPAGLAVIDSLELKASTAPEIESAMSMMPNEITAYFEIPLLLASSLAPVLSRTKARAKVRTGGVVADAFPDPDAIAAFMIACRDAYVPFKLTAGLHHPLRGEYRLTYAENPPRGMMFGYLNAFIAAALAWNGADMETVSSALVVSDPASFHFTDSGMAFRGTVVTTFGIADARENFVVSFGSCSFREPVDELALLNFT